MSSFEFFFESLLILWNKWKEKRRLQMLTVLNVTERRTLKSIKQNDALRKKRARLLLKSNKDAHEEHKKKERKENVWLNTERICNKLPPFGLRPHLELGPKMLRIKLSLSP